MRRCRDHRRAGVFLDKSLGALRLRDGLPFPARLLDGPPPRPHQRLLPHPVRRHNLRDGDDCSPRNDYFHEAAAGAVEDRGDVSSRAPRHVRCRFLYLPALYGPDACDRRSSPAHGRHRGSHNDAESRYGGRPHGRRAFRDFDVLHSGFRGLPAHRFCAEEGKPPAS